MTSEKTMHESYHVDFEENEEGDRVIVMAPNPDCPYCEDLDWLRANWNPANPSFRAWLAGSDRAHHILGRYIKAQQIVLSGDKS